VSGEGKVLILLHGRPGFWKDWERVVEPLSSSAMLVLQDLKGFGLSDKPESVEEYAPSSCKTIGPTAEPSSGSRLAGREVHRDACCLGIRRTETPNPSSASAPYRTKIMTSYTRRSLGNDGVPEDSDPLYLSLHDVTGLKVGLP
jgi:hypothetical protein